MGIYHRPDKLKDALALLEDGRVIIAAGCTDLFAATQAQALGTGLDEVILDVTGLSEFKGIQQVAKGWRIGAGASWSDVVATPLPAAFDMLKQAALQVGGVQVQNAGTVVGNICNASPAADGIPPLLALDAEVELLRPGGIRRMALVDFVTGPRATARKGDELVSAILVPHCSATGASAFEKLGSRSHLVISVAMVAARLEISEGHVAGAAVAVGACSPVAMRLPTLEAALFGAPIADLSRAIGDSDFADILQPISDIRGSAAYRLEAVPELVRRAVLAAASGPLQ
ncbi:FAD binding domain-containing protein [Shimia sp. MMG029]|uniref:FAD binding domain-containing protein n=1 Tax=Shimia sp. MMG029 TaxID=3021978 RepID=UPI0022FE5C7A|nr:FAD binding domain-containing protein [Shimia sp. MMG029]MDA5555900.1 FAD binding domain-containing protein [Shimia sp. MMG029]